MKEGRNGEGGSPEGTGRAVVTGHGFFASRRSLLGSTISQPFLFLGSSAHHGWVQEPTPAGKIRGSVCPAAQNRGGPAVSLQGHLRGHLSPPWSFHQVQGHSAGHGAARPRRLARANTLTCMTNLRGVDRIPPLQNEFCEVNQCAADDTATEWRSGDSNASLSGF